MKSIFGLIFFIEILSCDKRCWAVKDSKDLKNIWYLKQVVILYSNE